MLLACAKYQTMSSTSAGAGRRLLLAGGCATGKMAAEGAYLGR